MREHARPLAAILAGLVALPAVVLTILRLVGGSSNRLATVQAFTPWAIPAYLLAVVVLGALLLRPAARRPGRRPVAVAATVAAVGLALHGWWLAPAVWGSAPEADPDAERLDVMSANLRFGEADPEELLAAIHEHGVDLLVLQEVTPEALASLEAAGLGARFPHRAGAARTGSSGTMAFSRKPVSDVVPIDTVMDSWAFTTGGLRILAVHPAYPLSESWGAELALLRDAVVAEEPDIVAGDFNASRDHAPMRAILDTGLEDAADLVSEGWQPTWPTNGFRGLPIPASVAIDHVLLGPDLTATATTTVEIRGTDHRALVATIAPRRPA